MTAEPAARPPIKRVDTSRRLVFTDLDPNTAGDHASSYADLVERLFRDFENQVPLTKIVEVVNQCQHQLRGSPPHALPELVERLARHRLGAEPDAAGAN